MQSKDNVQLNIASDADYRNVTSTAKLFNFRYPVYMTAAVWANCVELKSEEGRFGELVVLQRLRHVLFMAASARQGRDDDFEQEFCVYCVPNVSDDEGVRLPHPVNLNLASHKNEHETLIYTITQLDK